ncbi:TetR/AcrR family transcriptional regulator [Mammaliicoccus stepanovicii]|uniref:Putative transcriptional regulator n=1 Tax=Mammaliicoccus stepanovicii TaxID=643214 RepID=A0A240A588_9STAP|nr:TetR/AcrR family transcriptional regulator [Mammaliicoccus stepanovicii]PNZ71909.1 TetR family transcriptional regulator [Mammaliicoccus stepanovicii]GGI39471.1 TetR family transcriptional regulator [Mammaliicoccus stepanovicii]SNV78056.1 putative transcriptional regulator [Mammaliicoccus stepanovicii]
MAEDRRVRKSKTAIKQAFIQLLSEKNIEHITIQQISDLADVNRGTFYLNFEDKYVLLEEMENEKIVEIKSYLDISQLDLSNKTVEEFMQEFSNLVIKKVLEHINENLAFYQVILGMGRKSMIEEQIFGMINKNITYLIGDNETVFGIPIDYYLSYVSGSMFSMITYWVNDSDRVSVDDLVQYVLKIATTGPLSILKQLVDERGN